MAMKARTQRIDASILLTHAYPDQMKQIEACVGSIARVKAQLLARSDTATRIARIKILKAQVDAGRYIVDSRAIAQKINFSPVMIAMQVYGTNDTNEPAASQEIFKPWN
jgi:anti-sigma-28 factor FlgM